MISTRHKRGLGVAASAASLAILFAALPAGAAFADPSPDASDITTESVVWKDVDDRTGTIRDAAALSGWTDDAVDGFGDLTIRNPITAEAFAFEDLYPAERTELDGTTTLLYQQVIVWNDDSTSIVDLTLTFEGSFARWSAIVSGFSAVELTLAGTIGANSSVEYTAAGAGVVTDDGGNNDPVLGFSASTSGTFTGWTAESGVDQFSASASGSDLSVTLVYGDYSPCGYDEAHTFIESITPSLAGVFGTAYAPFGSCFSVPEQTITAGTAIDLRVPFVIADGTDPETFAQHPDVTVEITSLPNGLTAVVEYDANGLPVLHLTGSALEAGTVTAVVTFAGIEYVFAGDVGPTVAAQRAVIAPGPIAAQTLAANVAITVLAAPASPEAPSYVPAPGDALAATGVEGGILSGAAALLALFGIGALIFARRTTRA